MGEMSQGPLPPPFLGHWQWQAEGACLTSDPESFFHPQNERGSRRRRREDLAKAVCATCPVLRHCREFALQTREAYGTWGGLSEVDRQAIWAAQRRPPG